MVSIVKEAFTRRSIISLQTSLALRVECDRCVIAYTGDEWTDELLDAASAADDFEGGELGLCTGERPARARRRPRDAGAEEDRTLARLRGLRSDLIDPAIAAHQGRIVKRTGDSVCASTVCAAAGTRGAPRRKRTR